jgi:hypothetical protein
MPSEDEYFDEFWDFAGTANGFDAFYTIYQESGAADDIDTWFQFLNAFYPESESGLHSKEYWDDLRNLYYEYSGVTAENIDWSLFREWLEANTP